MYGHCTQWPYEMVQSDKPYKDILHTAVPAVTVHWETFKYYLILIMQIFSLNSVYMTT